MNNNLQNWEKYIKKENLFVKEGSINKSLIENKKIVIGIYIREYEYDKGFYNKYI